MVANNFVNVTVPGPTTHEDVLQTLCASATRPIPIVVCCKELRSISLPRGAVLFGMAGNLIDQVARNHDGVEWWVTNSGLHLEVVPSPSSVPSLLMFDQIAGPMVIERWGLDSQRHNTKLSEKSLIETAAKLDLQELGVKDVLQSTQREKLALHNQKAGKAAIKSFERLAKSPKLSRMLRQRLCLARQRYSKAIETAVSPPSYRIPKIFHSYPIN